MTTAKTLSLPSIHLNGTARQELLNQTVDAISAIRRAVSALEEAAPNARDYYPQGPTAYQTARDEHEGYIKDLENIEKALEKKAEFIANNGKRS